MATIFISYVTDKYRRIPNTKEDNWVWSPRRVVNIHIPSDGAKRFVN